MPLDCQPKNLCLGRCFHHRSFIHSIRPRVRHRAETNFFASEELQDEFTRFFKLVKKFGYAISATQKLIELIKLKFKKDDVFSEIELLAFRNIFLNRYNSLEQLASKLTNIKDSKRAVHWLVLPT